MLLFSRKIRCPRDKFQDHFLSIILSLALKQDKVRSHYLATVSWLDRIYTLYSLSIKREKGRMRRLLSTCEFIRWGLTEKDGQYKLVFTYAMFLFPLYCLAGGDILFTVLQIFLSS